MVSPRDSATRCYRGHTNKEVRDHDESELPSVKVTLEICTKLHKEVPMYVHRSKTETGLDNTLGAEGATPSFRASTPSVLIVTPSTDESAVFQAILARQGIDATTTRSAEEGLQQALQGVPDVLVLDEDVLATAALAIEYAAVADSLGCQLIVLGKLRMPYGCIQNCIEIGKPYEYATLIRRILAFTLKRCAA